MSLVNDTVATLAACRYQDQDTMIGVILGTGSNGAYVERAERVHNAAKKLPKGAQMIVNCEWGNLTTHAMPRIDEDRAIDDESVNPDNQHFEKMTAGNALANSFQLHFPAHRCLGKLVSYCGNKNRAHEAVSSFQCAAIFHRCACIVHGMCLNMSLAW